jgi:hypothetical protein
MVDRLKPSAQSARNQSEKAVDEVLVSALTMSVAGNLEKRMRSER